MLSRLSAHWSGRTPSLWRAKRPRESGAEQFEGPDGAGRSCGGTAVGLVRSCEAKTACGAEIPGSPLSFSDIAELTGTVAFLTLTQPEGTCRGTSPVSRTYGYILGVCGLKRWSRSEWRLRVLNKVGPPLKRPNWVNHNHGRWQGGTRGRVGSGEGKHPDRRPTRV